MNTSRSPRRSRSRTPKGHSRSRRLLPEGHRGGVERGTRTGKTEPIPLDKLELLERVAYLRRLLTKASETEHRKLDELEVMAANLNMVFNHALEGDWLTGYFLAVLLAFFNKRRKALEHGNASFRFLYDKLESEILATKRSRGLREKVEGIIVTGYCYRQASEVSECLMRNRGLSIDFKFMEESLLPDPDYRSPDAVRKWSDYVYHELKMKRRWLAKQPGIGDLERNQVNGRFQLSRLRHQIPPIVTRVFKMWPFSMRRWLVSAQRRDEFLQQR